MTTKHSTSVSSIDENTRLESFDSKLINEVVEHSFIPAAYIGTSLRPDERRSDASKMVEQPACSLVKYGGQDALRQSAGIKKSNGCPESSLCASSLTECNVEQKLIDFVPQTARKVGIRKSKMTMEISSNTKVISKAEKEQKSKVTDDNTRSNQVSKKCEKLGHLEQCEDKEHGTSHGNSKTSASQLQKKRKRTSSPLTADTRERTAWLGSKDLNRDLRKKRKVTSAFTCTAEVKDLSLSLPLQDLHRDATNGSIEEDLKHPERKDSEIVEASKSQKQRNMTSTFTIPAEIKDLSLGVGMQNLHKDRDATNGKAVENPLIVKSYSGDDSHARNLVPYAIPTPIPSQRLMEMTVGKLKDLAKRLELKSIHKLRKMELVDLLAKTQGGH
ncbi:hypothetical protein ACLB2K_066223 [Fragaria x ananassa]